jgi:xanthine dehydrogenase accessory factor
MTADWIAALAQLSADGKAAVLVTVLEAQGSTPRERGCKMVVSGAAIAGTIGGGHLEYTAIDIARRLLADDAGSEGPLVREFPLGPSLGQCCGGAATLLFEAIRPPARQLVLFGAGHVGRAFVRVMSEVPCRIIWIDSRPDEFPSELPPNVSKLVSEAPEFEIAGLPLESHVLVMSHSHQTDLAIVEAALRRGGFPYVGLIGSQTKRARFTRRLAQRGIPADAIVTLVCPIGIPDAGGKHPAEIAVAVAAQILQVRPSMARDPRTAEQSDDVRAE